jgi:hypothetical protein
LSRSLTKVSHAYFERRLRRLGRQWYRGSVKVIPMTLAIDAVGKDLQYGFSAFQRIAALAWNRRNSGRESVARWLYDLRDGLYLC